MNLVDCSMVLEGGAIKGVFTAGVLDYLMEQNFYTKYVVGVSAGACNAVDYVSKQIGRSRDCFIPGSKADRYIKMSNVFRRKPVYDMDIVFDYFPMKRIPFDFDTYYASDMECEVVTTNCRAGKAEYMKAPEDRREFLKILRASSSMPFLCDMVYLEDTPYLDGGMADSIPLKRAIDQGYKKHIVILTKNKGYRKSKSKWAAALSGRKYAEFPDFRKLIENRWKLYNETIDWLEKMENAGAVFVIRPEMPAISRLERNRKKAIAFYNHGYAVMKERFNELNQYVKSLKAGRRQD